MTDIPDLNGRYDLYGAVHKGLRKAGCELLVRLGSIDYADPLECDTTLESLRGYLMLAASHVMHEDENIHNMLRERGGSTDVVDDQHDDHRAAFALLEKLALDIEKAWPLHKPAAGRRLYLALAAYLAEDLAHMHEEETVIAPALWRSFTDQELVVLEMRIVASLSPEKNMAFMRMMIPAMNPAERAALLGAMRKGAPPEVFSAVIEFAVRPGLSEKAFSDLANRLQLAA
jgi:iron-sulfur cluster repair protein YtfE (RIC family)